jgi:hypothetical protein
MHGSKLAYNRWMMDWPDLGSMSLNAPQNLPVIVVCAAAVALAAFVVGRRHGRARYAALGLRLVALAALGVALLAPITTVHSEARFEPDGHWSLVLPGVRTFSGSAREFREPPDVFVARVRDALATGQPPVSTEVHALAREEALHVRDAVQALGIPCRAIFPGDDAGASAPVITGISAPRAVKPGEPFAAEFAVTGGGGTLRVTLDGRPLEITGNSIEIRLDEPGRHVLEVVLTDAQGVELQRAGHVFRVGEWPHVLAIGLDDKQLTRARELAPDMRIEGVAAEAFRAANLRHDDTAIELALINVDSLSRLGDDQAAALAMFVARGGGLLVTGDGARYVAPEYLARDARNLLPVILQKEGRKPPPEDPKLEEQPIKAEIAKVSMCFVLDRSYSMTAPIGTTRTTRWNVATTGVIESLKLVDSGGRRNGTDNASEAYATRIGVMGFNLEQHWIFGMKAALPFDRDQIGRDLARMGDELTQVARSDFDAQGWNTDIYAAMKNAIEVMKEEKSAVKVIVMLTDGADRDANTKAGLKHGDLRKLAIANDINIVAIGIGSGFDSSTDGDAARDLIKELATRPEFAHIATDETSAAKADVIFVDSVETAFQAYDDKKKKEEDERKRKIEEDKEPPKVDVMPGTFPLLMGPAGEQLFGRNALPEPGPKVGWLARNYARDGSAVALVAQTEDPAATPVLALIGYGLGRVGFWGAGTDPEALGELTGWTEFPGLFAGTMRWLLPREEPDVRLLAEATPEGVRILDPLEHADYVLRTGDKEVLLELKDGVLTAAQAIPLGPGEVIERVSTDEETLERSIGDVFVAVNPPTTAKQVAVDTESNLSPLTAKPPEVTTSTREATLPMLYLLLITLLFMPFERLVRRRS